MGLIIGWHLGLLRDGSPSPFLTFFQSAMRHFHLWITFLIGFFATLPAAEAQRNYSAEEYVIISGGPALRKWEDFRVPAEQHDRYGGNFIKAADHRMQQLRRLHGAALRITWLIYRPAYDKRDREDATRRPPYTCNLAEINQRASQAGARIIWYSNTGFVIDYLNNRRGGLLSGLEYFGHSNKYAWLFEYGSDILGVSTCYLHSKQLPRLRRGLFAAGAHVQSWGCHTGEYMSQAFKRATGQGMLGTTGKTDYRAIGDNKSLPSAGGWTQ
jgi:hypothetical protein